MGLCLQLNKLKHSLVFAVFVTSLASNNVHENLALTKVVMDIRNCSLGNQLLYR